MHRQPECAGSGLEDSVRGSGGEEDHFTTFQRTGLSLDFQLSTPLYDNDPLILLLTILSLIGGIGAEDSYDPDVFVLQEGGEAFTVLRRNAIKEIHRRV